MPQLRGVPAGTWVATLMVLACLPLATLGMQEASQAVTMLQAEEGVAKVMSREEADKFMTGTKLDLVSKGEVKITKLYKKVGKLRLSPVSFHLLRPPDVFAHISQPDL